MFEDVLFNHCLAAGAGAESSPNNLGRTRKAIRMYIQYLLRNDCSYFCASGVSSFFSIPVDVYFFYGLSKIGREPASGASTFAVVWKAVKSAVVMIRRFFADFSFDARYL